MRIIGVETTCKNNSIGIAMMRSGVVNRRAELRLNRPSWPRATRSGFVRAEVSAVPMSLWQQRLLSQVRLMEDLSEGNS